MRPDRRAPLVLSLAAGALVAAAALLASSAQADDSHVHEKRSEITLAELTPDQRNAALEAWSHVVCACTKENWARTLANCPDGCADRQKQQVLGRVLGGWSLDAIVEEQTQIYGPKAAADPGTALNGTLVVLAGVILGGAAAGLVLSRWKKAADERHAAAADQRRDEPVEDAEADAIERELREIE